MQIKPIAAVNAVIFNDKKEVLLTKRSAHIREPGKWCLPGGHVDGGESWTRAVRREVLEEVGLKVLDETLLGIYSDPKLTITESKLSDGTYGHFLVITFLVEDFEGAPRNTDEVCEWGWFPKGVLPSPIIKSHPIRITDAYQFNGFAFVR